MALSGLFLAFLPIHFFYTVITDRSKLLPFRIRLLTATLWLHGGATTSTLWQLAFSASSPTV